MTPFEFNLLVDVYQEKQKTESEKDLMNAYMTAYFHRIEKLERFETYRSKLDQFEEAKPKQMSNEDMLAKVMALHNSMNGKTVNETGVGE